MTAVLMLTAVLNAATPSVGDTQDRWVFLFGYSLLNEEHVQAMEEIVERAGKSGYTGAVLGGVDRMSQQGAEYFEHLDRVRSTCRASGLELIPRSSRWGTAGPSSRTTSILPKACP